MSHALAAPALNIAAIAVAIFVGLVSLAWIPGLRDPSAGCADPTRRPPAGRDRVVRHDDLLGAPLVARGAIPVALPRACTTRPRRSTGSAGSATIPSTARSSPHRSSSCWPPASPLSSPACWRSSRSSPGLFLHANVRWRWRPLHRVVITPEFHHWHHANEVDAHNSNYSVFLPLWDIVFGTYYMPRNKRPLVYGISEDMPDGLIPQLREPLRGMGNPLRIVRHPFAASVAAGASPATCVETSGYRPPVPERIPSRRRRELRVHPTRVRAAHLRVQDPRVGSISVRSMSIGAAMELGLRTAADGVGPAVIHETYEGMERSGLHHTGRRRRAPPRRSGHPHRGGVQRRRPRSPSPRR